MEENNPELETFRQQWRAEVTARTKQDELKYEETEQFRSSAPSSSRILRKPLGSSLPDEIYKDDENDGDRSIGEVGLSKLESSAYNDIQGFSNKLGGQEPQSALEHYEKAVERESQGSLGDSVALYRKAFKV